MKINNNNNNDLPKFALGPPLGSTPDVDSGKHETLSIVRHVGLHVYFSSMK